MIRETVTASPLHWPPGWERAKRPTRSRFGDASIYREIRELGWELDRLGAHPGSRIVSTNLRLRQVGLPYSYQRRVDDEGVSVWSDLDGEERAAGLRSMGPHRAQPPRDPQGHRPVTGQIRLVRGVLVRRILSGGDEKTV